MLASRLAYHQRKSLSLALDEFGFLRIFLQGVWLVIISSVGTLYCSKSFGIPAEEEPSIQTVEHSCSAVAISRVASFHPGTLNQVKDDISLLHVLPFLQ
jgi:hypothetical protein